MLNLPLNKIRQSLAHPILKKAVPILSSLLIIGIFSYASWFSYQYDIASEKQRVRDEMSTTISNFIYQINQTMDKARGLLVYYQLHPDSTVDELNKFSEKLFSQQNDLIKEVQLTEGTTVSYVYPPKLNDSLIGQDLLLSQTEFLSVVKTKNTRRTVITVSTDMATGSQKIISRVPIMSYENGLPKNFIGLLNVILDYDRLLGNSGLLQSTKNYNLNLYTLSELKQTKVRLFSPGVSRLVDPISLPVPLEDNYWILEVEPIGGWRSPTNQYLYLPILGLFIAILVFVYLSSLLKSHARLNHQVTLRTKELEESLVSLNQAQEQLIQSEKLASLGELVSGVAHELNTPLGVSITLSSFLIEQHQTLKEHMDSNKMTKKHLLDYLSSTNDSLMMLENNLSRTADIVTSFKTVASNQDNLEIGTFNLYAYTTDVLVTLQPKIRTANLEVNLECDPTLEIVSYPGAISYILSNLVMNSILHGYENNQRGTITIRYDQTDGAIQLHYVDDGQGIKESVIEKVFNPFYTTNRSKGCTGLGLHIVHNMVSQVLNGQIALQSKEKQGVEVDIVFKPLSITH
ncbi:MULTISPECIES: ATP-binding protein [unclassified Fusibacter]|uniref:sensor histidine kinase n=1 Tax=unclassified Fusibacter TaxID=2624464 RepID=UPI001010C2BD|nr:MULTISPECIES: ATP-binding protein [unclassified Fusibacter]MCK8060768.1 ATP-binding protein [Fusibacter sp. A2]NPE23064.1 hypothetical protein [Fusibacter sp. A1]RXV59736.1 hypothetical protein DWB64_14575 [Fusibacter sp. A1]